MHLDSNLRVEVLSSLLGENLRPYDKKRYRRTADILSVDDFHLNTITGKRRRCAKERFIDEEDFFDPQFDCDFSDFSDSAECKRGDELYERPKGWYRMALKVRGKYPDGDTWLGTSGWRSQSVPGEWPVSYHGTSLAGVKGIIWSHYKAGDRTLYGRGIYSTPDIHIAEKEDYARTFTSKTTGKSYKVILQNRINPERREICQRSDHWLVRVHQQASAKEEKQTVESSIRPYGILIKEISVDGDSGDDTGHEDRDDDDTVDDDRSDGGTVVDGGEEDQCDDDSADDEDRDSEDSGDEDRSDDGSVEDESCDDDTVDDRGEDDGSDGDSGDVATGDEDRSDDYSGGDDYNADERDDDDDDYGDDDYGDDHTGDHGRYDDDSGDDGHPYYHDSCDDGNHYDDSSDYD